MHSNAISIPNMPQAITGESKPTGKLRINSGVLEQEIYTVYHENYRPVRDGRHWAVVPVGVWDASPLAPEASHENG